MQRRLGWPAVKRIEMPGRGHFGNCDFFRIRACAGKVSLYDAPLLKMTARETILLDAQLEAVIDSHAFRAVLENGHRFTAYVAARDREKRCPETGDRVNVEMSPYNMSAGRIII